MKSMLYVGEKTDQYQQCIRFFFSYLHMVFISFYI